MSKVEDPILYRVMDFFEVVDLGAKKNLRISNASRFSDTNELIGVFLGVLEEPSFHHLNRKAFEDLRSYHSRLKEQYFISSWTKSRDNIAIWELYSRNSDAIQIGVRKSALEAILGDYCHERSFALAHGAEASDGRALFYPLKSSSCDYVQFSDELGRIRLRYQKFSRDFDANLGDQDAATEVYQEFSKERALDLLRLPFLKDRAYQHEEEHRFVLCGVTRNDRSYEECKEDKFFELFDTHIRPLRREDVGENIFVPVDPKIIEEVWIDGRCPPWKRDIQMALLKELGLDASVSPAYGSFFDFHEINPLF
ncbi:hypothetical protein [Ruegeria arenilitoris]|uniref:hypothetical protein n=1 Tax=Ruegeria arenilitoris TaxID=1173585 RepID=UPI00147CC326|nr:hypothetical protein [Ruegeria arenilitoris]